MGAPHSRLLAAVVVPLGQGCGVPFTALPVQWGFEGSLIKLGLVSGVKPRSCMDLYPIF